MEKMVEAIASSPWILWLVKATVILSAGLLVGRLMRRSTPGMRYLVWVTVFGVLFLLPVIQFKGAGWHVAVPVSGTDRSAVDVNTSETVTAAAPDSGTMMAEIHQDSRSYSSVNQDRQQELVLILSDSVLNRSDSGKLDSRPLLYAVKGWLKTVPAVWIALLFWMAGILILTGRLLVGRTQAGRLYRHSRLVSGLDWQFVMRFVRKVVRLRTSVDVVQNRDVSIPLTFGVSKPVVMLPDSAHKWDLERRRIVLMHEFVHVKRRDDLVRLVARLVTILYWFHPLAWLAFHRLKEEQEKVCDEIVLKSGIRASDYATHLVELARGLRPVPLAGAATLGMARRKELEGRLSNILDPHLQNRKEISMKKKVMTLVFLACGIGLMATMHLTVRAASWEEVSVDGHMGYAAHMAQDQEKPETPTAPDVPEAPEEVEVTTTVTVPDAPDKPEKEMLVSVKAPKATWVAADGDKKVQKIVVDVDADSPDAEKMYFLKKGEGDMVFVTPEGAIHVREELKKAMAELKKAMKELAAKEMELGKLDLELKQKLTGLKVDDKKIQKQLQEAMTQVQDQLKQQMEQNHQVMEQLRQSMEKLHQQLESNQMSWHTSGDNMKFHIQNLHELDDLEELEKLEKLEALKELEAIDEEELARKAEAIAKAHEAHAKQIEVIVKAREAEWMAREEAMRKREKEIQEKVEKRIKELEEKGMITEEQAMKERRKAMEEAMRARELELRKLEEERLKELQEKREIIILKQMELEEERLHKLEEKLKGHEVRVWKQTGGDRDIVIELDEDARYTIDDLKESGLEIAVRVTTEGLEKSELKKLQKAVKKLKKSVPDHVIFEEENKDSSLTVKLSTGEEQKLSDSERDQLDNAVDAFMDAVDEIKGVDEEDVRQIRMIKRDDNHTVTIRQKAD